MPSATTASFDDEFISERLLAFMNNGDYNVMTNNRGSTNGISMIGHPVSAQKTFSLDKNGALAFATKNPVTCNSPTHHMNSVSGFGAITSPSILNKYASGGLNSAFSTPNTKTIDDYHSLQNSPFYNHCPVNGNYLPIKHQNGGNFLLNGNMGPPRDNLDCQMPPRQAPQRELFPSMSLSRCDSGWANALASLNHGSGLLMQDRLHYYGIAQKQGFIVGPELDRIKDNSRRSTSHTYGRISAHFRNRYGETEAKTKAAYMQLGVRVPSKDHVSEIVGKGGQKIKLIREETGALITTPGEYEDHVFIIEAPPEIALRVADLIATRAQEITQSKLSASERRRGSTSSISGTGVPLFTGMNGVIPSVCSNVPSIPPCCNASSFLSGQQTTASRSPDDAESLHSPSPLLKSSPGGVLLNAITQSNPGVVSSGQNGDASNFNGFSQPHNISNGAGSSASGRVLLARSKISVPQDMVGKIIGTQGSIITTIQKDTGTEIKSPPKEAARGPTATSEFEISAYQSLGMTSNQAAECRVQQAKQLIGHLVMRQFERRASEDLEDHSSSASTGGRNNSAGTDDTTDQPLLSLSNGRGSWMWPEVAQMDSIEAREVLDRILAESKSKTRRAKELATASSVPPSPGGGVMPVGFNGGVDMFSEKTLSSASVVTPSMSISCHTSPFHQSPSIRGIPMNYHPQQTQTSHMLNGFMHDRLHSTCDYGESSDFDQQSYMNLNGHGNSTNGTSNGHSSAFWQQQQIDDFPLARHSSAGSTRKTVLEEHNGLPQSPRRHTDFAGLDRGSIDLLLGSLAEGLVKENNKPSSQDWGTTNRHSRLNGDCHTFDFISDLDRLALGSSEREVTSVSDLSYPPGFGFSASHNGAGSGGDLGHLDWPATNGNTSDLLESSFLNGIFTIGNEGHSGALQTNDAVRSIWSDSVTTGDAGSGSSGLFPGLAFPQSVINSFTTNGNGGHSNSNRCGAIGEGRRRSTPPQVAPYSPVSNSNGLGDALASAAATIPAV